jgi:hypothetical protein
MSRRDTFERIFFRVAVLYVLAVVVAGLVAAIVQHAPLGPILIVVGLVGIVGWLLVMVWRDTAA